MICAECGKKFNKSDKCPFCGAKVSLEADSLEVLELVDIDSEDVLELEELDLDVVELEPLEEDNKKAEFEDFIGDDQKVEIKIETKVYKENEPIWDLDDIKENLKKDKRRIKVIIFLVLACVGSFFNFWGIATDTIGNIKMGSLFTGYGLGGSLGKICVILCLVGIALTVVNLTRFALYAVISAIACIIAQGVAVILYSRASDFVYASVESRVYFDIGFYIIAVFGIIAAIMLSRSPEKKAEREKKKREAEISPDELLKRELEIRDEDIKRQKEKMTQKEEKRLEKEKIKQDKKNKKSGKKDKN